MAYRGSGRETAQQLLAFSDSVEQKPSNCLVRNQCLDDDRSIWRDQAIVGDESERNVDSPSNGLRPLFKC